MRVGLRWALLALAVVACVGVGYAAYTLAGISWDAVVSYRSPYAELPLPAAEGGSSEATRTVVVIVDGLRLDASREMGTLNALREYGADLELVAPQPSLSFPNWTTLLSGAPPYVSGVVTNWHEGRAPVETLFDTAARAKVKTVFVGPDDFERLYGVKAKCDATFMRKWSEEYLSAEYVDAAIQLAESEEPQLLVLHLPDIDEAGHAYGGASEEYAQAVAKVDRDLGRLVQAMQDGDTVFVVVADHGHIDSGGHGGWEDSVVSVPGLFAGPGINLVTDTAGSEDVASTVALLAGVPVPRYSLGRPITAVVGSDTTTATTNAQAAYRNFEDAYVRTVTAPLGVDADSAMSVSGSGGTGASWSVSAANDVRLAYDRGVRLPLGIGGAMAALAVLVLIAVASWRALVAALAGAVGYFAVYNALFFGVHGYLWSLSAFNSEDKVAAWMNGRLIEAAVSLLIGAAIAAVIYPLTRRYPKSPRGAYLPGWLTLGPTTALVVLALLGLQVAWFVWAWGIDPTWRLPDLMWAFKYDLDLIQATAVGFAAVASPLVTYLVGRYHPKVRTSTAEE